MPDDTGGGIPQSPVGLVKTVTVRPRFSVVIPTMDNAASISRSVGGVLSQTLAAVEVVVVDAGSTDSTLDAVATIADARVRVFADAPSIPEARAIGFGEARGRWTTTIDATDEVAPSWLARLAKLLDRSGASFISCGGDQRFADLTEAPIAPVALPALDGVTACLRSGSFTAPTRYFKALSPAELTDVVATGYALIEAVIAEGRECVSTPEALLRWNESPPVSVGESQDEQRLSWVMQALDALSRSPIPDSELLARWAAIGGEAAAHLGRRDEARKLYAIARDTLPDVPRYWFAWAGALMPFGHRSASAD